MEQEKLDELVAQLIKDHLAAAFREFKDAGCWQLLVTGPQTNRAHWFGAMGHAALDHKVAFIDTLELRDNTARCRLFLNKGEHDWDVSLSLAIEAAEKNDVTLQLLCIHGADESTREPPVDLGGGATVSVAWSLETYPVAYLGSHGQQWQEKQESKDASA